MIEGKNGRACGDAEDRRPWIKTPRKLHDHFLDHRRYPRMTISRVHDQATVGDKLSLTPAFYIRKTSPSTIGPEGDHRLSLIYFLTKRLRRTSGNPRSSCYSGTFHFFQDRIHIF